MTDIARLQKVVDYSLSLPEGDDWLDIRPELDAGWQQGDWLGMYAPDGDKIYDATITPQGLRTAEGHPCRTAACIAGNTVLLFAPEGTRVTRGGLTVSLPDGRADLTVEAYALELLGMDDAHTLFHGSNDAAEIRAITAAIIAGESDGA
jgi:hypothetical protein